MDAKERAVKGFIKAYGSMPKTVVSAPGRINLIGEHTDYQEGFVFPAAISYRTAVAAAFTDGSRIIASSEGFDQIADIKYESLDVESKVKGWAQYVAGVLYVLKESGVENVGLKLYYASDVPIGAGLSSSAAIEVSTMGAAMALTGEFPETQKERMAVAKLCQRAENKYVGMPCGIMDQAISACGKEGSALLLDCRTLDAKNCPVSDNFRVVGLDSGVKHALASSAYPKRRASVERAAALLNAKFGGIKTLRDATLEQVKTLKDGIAELSLEDADELFRRARHVVTEDERALKAVDALRGGDESAVRELLAGSHDSLRRDYEVTCRELDEMVEAAAGAPGFVGARMTGGGFGGCTVNIVRRGQEEVFMDYMKKRLPFIARAFASDMAEGMRVE